jgi:hypothetical protein
MRLQARVVWCVSNLLLFASCSQRASSSEEQVLEVCDVVDNRVALPSGDVRVAGRLEGADYHGYYLYSTKGIRSCKTSARLLFACPSAIALNLPEFGLPRLAELLHSKRDNSEGLPVVVVGRLSTKWPLWIHQANGGFQGNGFGNRGQYPYLLNVKGIKVTTSNYE